MTWNYRIRAASLALTLYKAQGRWFRALVYGLVGIGYGYCALVQWRKAGRMRGLQRADPSTVRPRRRLDRELQACCPHAQPAARGARCCEGNA